MAASTVPHRRLNRTVWTDCPFRVRVQAADDDPLPLSHHDGGALHTSYLVRLLRFFNCGLQDLR